MTSTRKELLPRSEIRQTQSAEVLHGFCAIFYVEAAYPAQQLPDICITEPE